VEVHVSADGRCSQAADKRHSFLPNRDSQRQEIVWAAGRVHVCACCQRLQSGGLLAISTCVVQGLLWVLLLRV